MSIEGWVVFGIFVLTILGLDLFVFHRKASTLSFKQALLCSGMSITVALLFNVYIYFARGSESATNFLTGYLIEKSLSIDNLFVFILIFDYFRTPSSSLHKVLFWGILGAIITRALLIFLGIAIVQKFHFIIFLFGVFLIATGIRFAIKKKKKIDPERNVWIRCFRRFFPVTPDYEYDRFFVLRSGKWIATPLFLVLIAIETTDIVFAIDSIPAILAITYDPFIVYTSNIFTILGLRSLFFALTGALKFFNYLHYGISAILVFVGIKMLVSDFVKLSPLTSFGILLLILLVAIFVSLFLSKRAEKK